MGKRLLGGATTTRAFPKGQSGGDRATPPLRNPWRLRTSASSWAHTTPAGGSRSFASSPYLTPRPASRFKGDRIQLISGLDTQPISFGSCQSSPATGLIPFEHRLRSNCRKTCAESSAWPGVAKPRCGASASERSYYVVIDKRSFTLFPTSRLAFLGQDPCFDDGQRFGH